MRMFRLLGLMGVAAMLSAPAMATTYDAVTDFSASNNPNGVWTYRDGSGNLMTHTEQPELAPRSGTTAAAFLAAATSE